MEDKSGINRRDFLRKSSLAALGSLLLSDNVFAKLSNLSQNEDVDDQINNNNKKMKIVVLTGSPRKRGNSAYLAAQFIKGAEEAGHSIYRFDAASSKVNGCTGCNRCGMDGDCIFNDDFNKVRPYIIDADMIVFATPMYYFGVSTQLKAVIDRFYAINGKIKGAKKKTAYIMTYANTIPKEAEPMLSHYQTLCDYLGWYNVGTVVAPGVWTAESVINTKYPNQAYQLGKSL